MAVKTWTNAEYIGTADLNTYCTNNGLQMIGAYNLTTNTVVSNIFTSTYENYRIVGTNFVGATGTGLTCRLIASGSSTASNYYYGGVWTNTAGTRFLFGGNNVAQWSISQCGATSTIPTSFVLDVFRPQKPTVTGLQNQSTVIIAGTMYNWLTNGNVNVNTVFDGIQFLHNAGADAYTGTIRVYGYRET